MCINVPIMMKMDMKQVLCVCARDMYVDIVSTHAHAVWVCSVVCLRTYMCGSEAHSQVAMASVRNPGFDTATLFP